MSCSDKTETVRITLDGKLCYAAKGTRLSELAFSELPCGGHGKCGKCKAIAHGDLSGLSDTEKKELTPNEIAEGIRLLCCTYALGDCEIKSIEKRSVSKVLVSGKNVISSFIPSFSHYGVAVDIGTTTVALRLYSRNGTVVSEYGTLNPQSAYGADVISRIEASMNGHVKELAVCIREAIDDSIAILCRTAGIDGNGIDYLVITGNTAMLHLLTEASTEPLSHAPFEAERLFGEVLKASELGLSFVSPNAEVYIPPCISAFVGADTVCALLSSGICESNETALLADIGTNGEMAIAHNGNLTVCSTAAGPAFEGVGISMGMRGANGAIDRVSIRDGELCAHVIGDTLPVGICGSGLVDAVACLVENETVDETGYMEDEEATVASPVVLTQKDIRMVQLAKSAICAGLCTLLDDSGIGAEKVSRLILAGGFGSYLDVNNAGRIGLIPDALVDKTSVIGNAALDGASMILLNSKLKNECKRLAQKAVTLELSSDKRFSEHYIDGMGF